MTEAVDLFLGMRPLEPDVPDHKADLCELAYRAIDAGTLPCIGKKKDRRVAPVEFAKWAASKGFEIPAHWNLAPLAHDGLRESDPATRGGGEVSAGAHPGYGPWQSPTLPPDYWLRNPKIGPLPERYERPRQCLIDEDDAISFSQARAILERRWNTTPTEIALWILGKHPGLHIFLGSHEIWEDWKNHEFSFLRCKPGLSGSTRPCSNLAERTFDLVDRETFANSFVDSLVNYKFSRSEIEDFDPANNEWDPAAPIEYIVDEGRNRLNPSGRLLIYTQAVTFLSAYSYAPEDAEAAIKRDYVRGGLIGLAPLGLVTQNMLGFDFDRAPMTETWFLEGQIVGLAKAEFGAPVTRWDAASRPEAAERVPLTASDALALSGDTGATEPAEAPRPTVAPAPGVQAPDEDEQVTGVEDVPFESTISFYEARKLLQDRLEANDYEIQQWIKEGRIQAYRQRLDNSCRKADPWRGSGNEREWYVRARRFLLEDVERFNPSSPSHHDCEPADYRHFHIMGIAEEMDLGDGRDHGFNPSCRFVSFRRSVAFLSTLADESEVVEQLHFESADRVASYGFSDDPFDFSGDEQPLDERYFYESQIVGLATAFYGRPFDGWDAITRPHPAAPLDDACLPIPAVAAVGEPPERQSPQQPRGPAPTAAGTPRTQSDAPARETERAQPKTKRTRTTRLKAAQVAARKALLKRLGHEPSAEEFFQYLADEDETGTILDRESDVLVWEDQQGNSHKVKFRTVATTLSSLRNA